MPDLVEVSKREERETVNGIERVFRYLNSYDKAAIIEEARNVRRKQIVDTCKVSGLTPEQIASDLNRYNDDPEGDFLQRRRIKIENEIARRKLDGTPAAENALLRFDSKPPDEFASFATDDSLGTTFALGLSLEKTYPNEGQKLAREHDMPYHRAFEIVCKICGLVVRNEPAGGSDTDSPTTTGPTTASTPKTNDTSSPASAA
jgi:hypothetical protein